MKIYYDSAGDLLETQFLSGLAHQRTGIGISEHITLFCDTEYSEVLGFTIFSYSKLLKLPAISTTELMQQPVVIQKRIQKLFSRSPLNRFFRLNENQIHLTDSQLSELIKAT